MSDAEGEGHPRCPWCSAELPAVLPADAPGTCPTCGAALTSATASEPDIRGVTTLDHEAILRVRSEMSRPRGRLLSFITGDTTTTEPMKPEELASLAPPDSEVRREMLRLEMEAQRAELEAESVALRTEAVIDQGLDLAADEGDEPPVEGPEEAAAAAAEEASAPAPAAASGGEAGSTASQEPASAARPVGSDEASAETGEGDDAASDGVPADEEPEGRATPAS